MCKMDRYIVREPRLATTANYPQGNQIIAFTSVGGNNNMIPTDNAIFYEGSYPNEFANMSPMRRVPSGYMQNVPQTQFGQNLIPCQGQVVSGIDPRYLAGYSDNNAEFIATGQEIQREVHNMNVRFGNDYQNRNFTGPEKTNMKAFVPQTASTPENLMHSNPMLRQNYIPRTHNTMQAKIYNQPPKTQIEQVQPNPTVPAKKPTEQEVKEEAQNVIMSRSDKLKALHKGGPRAFSGPVEKVLKWHKALQDIGVFVFYEIVAKCVSIRGGEACSKNLVVRDDNGPAMQVVYYEIDFLLPELKPPCVVRVIGRMLPGTCRLQAFHVRPATGDDVAMLSRRAAVAAHHVARLCKEYGTQAQNA